MRYVVYDTTTGEIVQSGSAPDPIDGTPSIVDAPLAPGLARLVGVDAAPETHRVVGGVALQLPAEVAERRRARPAHPVQWNWSTLDWDDARTPEQAVQAQRDSILRQIAALERQQLRSVRELTLGRGNQSQARQALEALDDQITVLRNQLP
jgi:hypothetical protein